MDIAAAREWGEQVQNQTAALQAAHSEERDLVNQLLGQAQMAEAFGKFSQTVWASKLAYVKENKLYRAIAGKKTPNGLELSGTWIEFCGLLGVSDEKANQDIANLRAFGEEALESMSRMGIGYREMRQFRRLPEDHKTALLEVAKTGDKEAFVDLAEELIARHTKEKEQLTKERDDAKADYEAQGARLAKVSAERDQAQMEAEKMRSRIATLPDDKVGEQLRAETAGIYSQLLSVLQTQLRPALNALLEHAEASGLDHRTYAAGMIRQVEQDLQGLRDELDLPDLQDADLSWMEPGALEEANARAAALAAEREA
ncbi:hypothetical protein AN401_07115 [Zobellella denitrificans]|uniref:Uncharacterized protein n=1 Tax=Zobellella denitrificans TaxID=347534 RepID=A0A291HUJ3_9GAMM|nr:hypothetical protein AN401_07115 [Zobellella denitrificans]